MGLRSTITTANNYGSLQLSNSYIYIRDIVHHPTTPPSYPTTPCPRIQRILYPTTPPPHHPILQPHVLQYSTIRILYPTTPPPHHPTPPHTTPPSYPTTPCPTVQHHKDTLSHYPMEYVMYLHMYYACMYIMYAP